MTKQTPYWFPAKRYGWGWGPPITWQGWVALAVYLVLIALGVFIYQPHHRPIAFVVCVTLLSVAFTLVCYLKGEPPRWRWGE